MAKKGMGKNRPDSKGTAPISGKIAISMGAKKTAYGMKISPHGFYTFHMYITTKKGRGPGYKFVMAPRPMSKKSK